MQEFNVLNGTECFEGTFSLELKLNSRLYQVPPRHVAYARQKPYKDELERPQQQNIITALGVDEMLE